MQIYIKIYMRFIKIKGGKFVRKHLILALCVLITCVFVGCSFERSIKGEYSATVAYNELDDISDNSTDILSGLADIGVAVIIKMLFDGNVQITEDKIIAESGISANYEMRDNVITLSGDSWGSTISGTITKKDNLLIFTFGKAVVTLKKK